jgi:hypothetical protein
VKILSLLRFFRVQTNANVRFATRLPPMQSNTNSKFATRLGRMQISSFCVECWIHIGYSLIAHAIFQAT